MLYSHFAAAIAGAAIAGAGAWHIQNWRYEGQIATIRAEHAEALAKAETEARDKEHALIAANRKVANAYAAEKSRHAADAIAADDALSVLNAALDAASKASANPSATGGTDATGNPSAELFRTSAAALVAMGKEADRLAAKVSGLQSFATNVCLK